jgi:hypothetical protein
VRGELICVWSESWREIWLPLAESEAAPADIFCELYRELSGALMHPPSIEALADVIDDTQQSWDAFENSSTCVFSSEKALLRFFEESYKVLEELQGIELAGRYFELLSAFIVKYSLRYSLRQPCMLCPTLPGIFADLMFNLRERAATNEHLATLMDSHEESIRDLRYGATEARIKTCIGRQFMLLEALAGTADNVNAHTLGAMCNELGFWPHATIRESLKKLYGFASDYPGIRHAGNPVGRIRNIDARDMVAVSVMLIGFSPYLTNDLEASFALLVEA